MGYLNSLIAGVVFTAVGVTSAVAADQIRVGKSVGNSLAFTPVDVGIAKGIWAKYDLEVETQVFGGEAKLQQALIAKSTDFALGSGPGMGFLSKGVDAKTIGAIAYEPLSMGLIAAADHKDAQALKGKRIGVSTPASLSYYLAREFSRQMGWGNDGITTVPLGALPANVAALRSGQIDAFVMSSSTGFALEKEGAASVVLDFGTVIPKFTTHVIFATGEVVRDKPDVVRRFLQGWIESVNFMFENKEETLKIINPVTGLPDDVASREYDVVMPMMSRDLRFSEENLAPVAKAIEEMGLAAGPIDMSELYTEEFLPKTQ